MTWYAKMNIHCKYDSLVEVGSLKPHPKNRNKHPDDQIERLAKILKYQGVRAPIVVSRRSNKIVKGHGTLQAIKANQWDKAPVVYQDFEDDDQEWLFVQSDNAIASWAELDLKGINADIGELGPFDIDLIGIKDFVVEPAEKDLGDEEAVPEARETNIKLGDLFVLGDHRLLCGDSTDPAQVERLMNGEKADLTITSPPYNVSVQGFQDAKYNTGFEKLTDEEYCYFLSKFTKICIEKSDYVFVNNQFLANNRISLICYQYEFKNKIKDILVWNKKQCPPNICKGAFNTKWEYVFVFSTDNKTRGFPCKWQGQYSNVIETESNSQNEFANIHKAGFPVAFPLWIIEKMDFASSILDVFGGTGTTLIACEKTNRKCFMMELDPQYCQVIIDRWEQYTGKKAVKHG